MNNFTKIVTHIDENSWSSIYFLTEKAYSRLLQVFEANVDNGLFGYADIMQFIYYELTNNVDYICSDDIEPDLFIEYDNFDTYWNE